MARLRLVRALFEAGISLDELALLCRALDGGDDAADILARLRSRVTARRKRLASHGFEVRARDGEYFPGHGFPNDGNSAQVAVDWGLPLGSKGFVNIAGEFDDSQQTHRDAQRPAAVYFIQGHPDLVGQLPFGSNPVQEWGRRPRAGRNCS